MKNIIRIIGTISILVSLMPLVALAAGPSLWPDGYWGPILSCTGSELVNTGRTDQELKQCKSFCDLLKTGQNAVYFGMTLVLFLAVPVLLVVGGIMIIFAGANPGLFTQGKKIITGTVVGLMLTLGSFIIVNTLLWAVGAKSEKVGWPIVSCNPENMPGTLR